MPPLDARARDPSDAGSIAVTGGRDQPRTEARERRSGRGFHRRRPDGLARASGDRPARREAASAAGDRQPVISSRTDDPDEEPSYALRSDGGRPPPRDERVGGGR